MQRKLARLFATSALAVAVTVTGWTATAAVAGATPPPSDTGTATAQDVWIAWKVYSSYESCRQAGRDMIGVGAVVDYRCTWDSPSWLLELRMVG
ncbi:hypothetical protein GCM10027445_40000 [Amycolatopsis endophytica]|uniref:Secreted protein n=1 Tax=Amycolatopsis endophytica TaxID=860233 RepID=A0A853B6Q9_9PSEU|nr:hypothetical protein [Amycolatopsis endophytica]NYI90759.1 hypothetical protein [Amycolatopsis endophytica]